MAITKKLQWGNFAMDIYHSVFACFSIFSPCHVSRSSAGNSSTNRAGDHVTFVYGNIVSLLMAAPII